MARYIDADAAIEQIRLIYCKECNSYNGILCRSCGFDDAMLLIDDIPAADVAPKSEVDNLFTEIEQFIELFISNDERIYNRDEDEFYDGRFSAFTIVQDHIAELKKKYTEGK